MRPGVDGYTAAYFSRLTPAVIVVKQDTVGVDVLIPGYPVGFRVQEALPGHDVKLTVATTGELAPLVYVMLTMKVCGKRDPGI